MYTATARRQADMRRAQVIFCNWWSRCPWATELHPCDTDGIHLGVARGQPHCVLCNALNRCPPRKKTLQRGKGFEESIGFPEMLVRGRCAPLGRRTGEGGHGRKQRRGNEPSLLPLWGKTTPRLTGTRSVLGPRSTEIGLAGRWPMFWTTSRPLLTDSWLLRDSPG